MLLHVTIDYELKLVDCSSSSDVVELLLLMSLMFLFI